MTQFKEFSEDTIRPPLKSNFRDKSNKRLEKKKDTNFIIAIKLF